MGVVTRAPCGGWWTRICGGRRIRRTGATSDARDIDKEAVDDLLGNGCQVEVLALGKDGLHTGIGNLAAWPFDLAEGFVTGVDDLYIHDRGV